MVKRATRFAQTRIPMFMSANSCNDLQLCRLPDRKPRLNFPCFACPSCRSSSGRRHWHFKIVACEGCLSQLHKTDELQKLSKPFQALKVFDAKSFDTPGLPLKTIEDRQREESVGTELAVASATKSFNVGLRCSILLEDVIPNVLQFEVRHPRQSGWMMISFSTDHDCCCFPCHLTCLTFQCLSLSILGHRVDEVHVKLFPLSNMILFG